MKKLLTLVLALLLALSLLPGALALNYTGCQGNEATFETLEEARLSGPAAVANLETNAGKTFVSHYVLDGYPEGTTFIYRSANLYGGRAAARLNTVLMVFAETHFENKADAKAYLEELGVIALMDEAIGSAILVTPADGAAFGQADQMNYYKLQTAVFAQKEAGKDAEGNAVSFCDAEYFGGFGYNYVIGIDGGATFLNNYVATQYDFVTRIAGMLLVNGSMEKVRKVASFVPVYLVGADEGVIAKYKAADSVNAYFSDADAVTYFNQALPLQRVAVAKTEKDVPAYIQDAYYGMFVHAMRIPVTKAGLVTAATPYQGYGFDQAPLSLCERNPMFGGRTQDGIVVLKHVDDRFADIKAFETEEYLQTWFEFLPEEVLNNTAPAGTVPLWVACQGGGDDPRLFVDEIGLLKLAGEERFAVVAPEEQYINYQRAGFTMKEGILTQVLPMLVDYMLEAYPALDASRVYITGYSMGGGATLRGSAGDPSKFAAIVPMAPAGYTPTEEQIARFDTIDMPCMFLTSSFDFAGFNAAEDHIGAGLMGQINYYMEFNELPEFEFDFAQYPLVGFAADTERFITVNGEYGNYTYFMLKGDVPMVGVTVTEYLNHALYPEYGKLAWDFAKHYSRNLDTLDVVYNPFVK